MYDGVTTLNIYVGDRSSADRAIQSTGVNGEAGWSYCDDDVIVHAVLG